VQLHALPSQIEFLEVRLAEVMAYADIPPSMRPALAEYDPFMSAMGQQGIRCAFRECRRCLYVQQMTPSCARWGSRVSGGCWYKEMQDYLSEDDPFDFLCGVLVLIRGGYGRHWQSTTPSWGSRRSGGCWSEDLEGAKVLD